MINDLRSKIYEDDRVALFLNLKSVFGVHQSKRNECRKMILKGEKT